MKKAKLIKYKIEFKTYTGKIPATVICNNYDLRDIFLSFTIDSDDGHSELVLMVCANDVLSVTKVDED